jgi:16S rRNA G527 N7-methylase RsmG
VVDIGTGGGLPGVVLALVRPDLRLTLLDAATKEIRFLESLSDIATFGLIMERAEIAGKDPNFREQYDVATGRAVALAAIQAEVSAAFVRVGGLYIPQRTAGEETLEYEELGLKLKKQAKVDVAGVHRLLPIYEKVSPTPDRFPRTWAAMKRKMA